MGLRRVDSRRMKVWTSEGIVPQLEERLLLSLTIQLDYSHDTLGYFNMHPAAKLVVEQAAQTLGSQIHDHLSAIPAGSGQGDTWTARPFDPSNVSSTLSLVNLAVPVDTIVVFVGATDLPGSTLGLGGSGGFSSLGSADWNTLVSTRGQSGVTAVPRRDTGTWGGSVAFDSNTVFSDSDKNSPPGNSGPDLYSVALHELGHVLGLVPGGSDYGYRNLATNTFNGPHAVAVFGGPVPLDSGGNHWADGVTSGGKPTALDPTVPPVGQRAVYTALDWAALEDVGWQVDSLTVNSAPPSSINAGSAFGLSVAVRYPDGTLDTTFNGTVTLSLESGPAGGTLGGTKTVSAVNGIATFTDLTLNAVGSGYVLRATSASNQTSVLTDAISVKPGATATHLVVTAQPASNIVAGDAFNLIVSAKDGSGNTDASFASSVTVAIGTNPGSATLGGTTTVVARQGVATFAGLSLNRVASGYTLTFSATGLGSTITSTFDVTQASASLSITPNQINTSYGQALVFTATLGGPSTLTDPTGTVQFVVDGVNLGSPVPVVAKLASSAAISSIGAGDHSISAIYSGNSTYLQKTAPTISQSVSPAPLTIQTDAKVKTYGGANPALTATYSGFVLEQGPGDLAGNLLISTSATATSPVGLYPIQAAGQTSSNYAITFQSKNLEITPASLQVLVNPSPKVYGQPNPPFGVTFHGFVLGESSDQVTGSPVFTTSATSASHVGAYEVKVLGLSASNYQIQFLPGTLHVTPAELTIKANSQTIQQGGSIPGLTVTYSGFVNQDSAASLLTQPTVSTTASSTSPSGVYAITVSGAVTTDYAITYQVGTLTVLAPPLVVAKSVQLGTIKVVRKNTTVIVVSFSEALDQTSAQVLGNYRLIAPGRDKKYGTRDDKVTALKSAVYDLGSRTVRLTPKAALAFAPSLRLQVIGTATGVRDRYGRPIDGNHDGIAGGDVIAVLTKNQVQLSSARPLSVLDQVLSTEKPSTILQRRVK